MMVTQIKMIQCLRVWRVRVCVFLPPLNAAVLREEKDINVYPGVGVRWCGVWLSGKLCEESENKVTE